MPRVCKSALPAHAGPLKSVLTVLTGFPDLWLTVILGVLMRVFLDEIITYSKSVFIYLMK